MMGWIVVILTQVVTVVLWLAAKVDNPAASFARGGSQILALLGIMCLVWTFVLSIRHKWIEEMFGGLDKMYKAHHIIGGLAFVFLINHALLLIVDLLPENGIAFYLIPATRISFTYGQISLYIMLILLALTFYINLPYRLWKLTHEWMGLVMIFGGLHTMLIRSDTQSYMLLRYWILGWSAVATFAFLYKRFVYYYFPRPVRYKVTTIGNQGDLLVLSLESVDPGIKFAPAQYGFVSLPSRKRDEHPLSVLGSDETKLILGVKVIGKFTKKLSELFKGDEVLVRGPFGLLSEKMEKAKHAVWIAGGIGITPFLSMAMAVRADQKVDMYFCASVMPAQVITEPFAALCARNNNFHWLPCETSKTGRVTAAQILDHTGRDLDAMYLLCGPKVMMEDLATQFAKSGIKRSHIIYEDFAFK